MKGCVDQGKDLCIIHLGCSYDLDVILYGASIISYLAA
jgi:hypothetical protein